MSVEIRHAEPSDWRELHELHAQPRVVAGTLQMPLQKEENWRRRLSDRPDDLITLVALLEGRVVGCASLDVLSRYPRRRHVGELGVAVHDDFQVRGIGRALVEALLGLADDWFGLRRVELTVLAGNDGALRLYESLGFEREGLLRDYGFGEGRYTDAVAMARLRPGP